MDQCKSVLAYKYMRHLGVVISIWIHKPVAITEEKYWIDSFEDIEFYRAGEYVLLDGSFLLAWLTGAPVI